MSMNVSKRTINKLVRYYKKHDEALLPDERRKLRQLILNNLKKAFGSDYAWADSLFLGILMKDKKANCQTFYAVLKCLGVTVVDIGPQDEENKEILETYRSKFE